MAEPNGEELLPICSDPDYSKWPNFINAMLVSIKLFVFQESDPEGYREWLNKAKANPKVSIKGSAEAGRKKGDT